MGKPQESKLSSAIGLVRGMQGLALGGAVSVPRGDFESARSAEVARNFRILDNALPRIVLYAIVVELVVKHVWEQEHSRTAPRTHDVLGLFKQLKLATRREVEDVYDDCCRPYKDWIRDFYRDALRAGRVAYGFETERLNIAALDEALAWNETATRDLKYTMKPSGRYVPAGLAWIGDLLVIPSSPLPDFAVEFTQWADRQRSADTSPV